MRDEPLRELKNAITVLESFVAHKSLDKNPKSILSNMKAIAKKLFFAHKGLNVEEVTNQVLDARDIIKSHANLIPTLLKQENLEHTTFAAKAIEVIKKYNQFVTAKIDHQETGTINYEVRQQREVAGNSIEIAQTIQNSIFKADDQVNQLTYFTTTHIPAHQVILDSFYVKAYRLILPYTGQQAQAGDLLNLIKKTPVVFNSYQVDGQDRIEVLQTLKLSSELQFEILATFSYIMAMPIYKSCLINQIAQPPFNAPLSTIGFSYGPEIVQVKPFRIEQTPRLQTFTNLIEDSAQKIAASADKLTSLIQQKEKIFRSEPELIDLHKNIYLSLLSNLKCSQSETVVDEFYKFATEQAHVYKYLSSVQAKINFILFTAPQKKLIQHLSALDQPKIRSKELKEKESFVKSEIESSIKNLVEKHDGPKIEKEFIKLITDLLNQAHLQILQQYMSETINIRPPALMDQMALKVQTIAFFQQYLYLQEIANIDMLLNDSLLIKESMLSAYKLIAEIHSSLSFDDVQSLSAEIVGELENYFQSRSTLRK